MLAIRTVIFITAAVAVIHWTHLITWFVEWWRQPNHLQEESLMSPFIGEDRNVDPSSLLAMQKRGGKWAVYQNCALDSSNYGHMQFLNIGKDCSFREAPDRLPDTEKSTNWAYLHVGYVDLEKGVVIDGPEKTRSAAR